MSIGHRSCDLIPLDFFLWGYLKSKVYANKPLEKTLDELKVNICTEIAEINAIVCENVIENYDFRIKACKCSHGDHLNDIIFHVQLSLNILITKIKKTKKF